MCLTTGSPREEVREVRMNLLATLYKLRHLLWDEKWNATDVQTLMSVEVGMMLVEELASLNQHLASLSKQWYDGQHA